MQTRSWRTLLFGSTYFVQGAVFAYLGSFNALYLRSYDVPYSKIGVAGAIALSPFMLKMFIGYLSDKVSLFHLGHRKPYIGVGLLLQIAGLLALTAVNPARSFGLYVAMLTLVLVGMSTYDTTTDGLAIDTTPAEGRGSIQGLMVGAKALASIVLAALFGLLVARVSWIAPFLFMAVLTLLPLIPLTRVAEAARPTEKAFSSAAFQAFLDVRMALFLLLGILQPLALYGVQGVIGAFVNESLSVPLERVGLYASLIGVGTVLGGLAGGRVVDRLGRRDAMLLAYGTASLALIALGLTLSPVVAVATVLIFGVCFGFHSTAYFSAAMDRSDPRIAASAFAIIMAMGNIGIGLGQPLAGILIERAGFHGMFFALSVINLVGVPLVFAIFPRRAAQQVQAG